MSSTGEMIGPYLLGRCLGRGSFGVVFEGAHRETGQRVAIKILHGSRELEPEVQNRFVREVALLQKLDHPNVVRVFEAGLHEGSIYCALELVECGSLKEVLAARHCLPWREAAEVAVQICRALDHAHARGCVHRDLKPANFYLSEDGFVKVGDLGLARDLNDSRLTTSGQTVGTWRYMAPEQIRGEDDIDGRLDIYAMGCILFQMICGSVPFDGDNFAQIFDQHLEEMPPRLDVVVADCPSELADLVEAMLAKDPGARPATAGEVAETLEDLLAGTSAATRLRFAQTPPDGLADQENHSGPNLTQRLHSGTADEPRTSPPWRYLIPIGIVVAVLIAVAVMSGK